MKRPKIKRPSFSRSNKPAAPKAATLRKPRAAKKAAAGDATQKTRPAEQMAPPEKKPPAENKPPAEKKPLAEKKTAKEKKAAKDDLWFRSSTRVRAAGYWLREKGQAGVALGKEGAARAGDFWAKRSHTDRIRIGAVAGVLLLYLVIKFIPVPGVPCGVSAVKECAPGDDAIELVPADALLYAHVTLDADTAQAERAGDAFEQLSELDRLVVGSGSAAVPAPSGAAVDIRADVLPWAKDDLAIATVPLPKKGSATAAIAGVGDRAGADSFLAKVAPAETAVSQKQGELSLSAYPSGFAYAFDGDQLVFGDVQAVRAALDTASGKADGLEGSDQGAPRDDLPEARFAEVYLSRVGVQRLLAGRVGPAAQLETFVDYGATKGIAAAAAAKDDGIEVSLVSDLDPKLTGKSPSFFSSLPDFEPGLADEAGSRAIGYVGVGEIGPTFAELLAQPGARGIAGSLQSLGAALQADAGVNPLDDLLPALGGEAALVAEPTDGVPFASLIVDGVDEDKASEALARLQRPLLRSLDPGSGQVPRFEEADVDGVTVRSVRLAPTVNLSYALFDGKLVLSTDPAGIAQVRDGGDSLADSGAYETATDGLPDEVSALVFLNLDELFGQVTRSGLVEDPSFADLTVLFDNASSLGLSVNGDEDSIRSELFLTLD